MSFLSPLFLAGLAAAAIPLAIHLFHRRAEPVVAFAAIRYLRQAPVEHAQRRKLKELLLLALRVAALVLLALTFARPYVSQAAALNAATVVLLDTSASLSAPGQFDRARTRAIEIVQTAPPSHAVAVLTFAGHADVIAPLSSDRAAAAAAIALVQPGAGATRYGTALTRAAEVLDGRGGRIVVVSDLQATGWASPDPGGVPDDVAIEIEEVDGPKTNVALASLRIEGTDAVALVQNFSDAPERTTVTVTADDRVLGTVPVSIGAAATAEVRVAGVPASAGADTPRVLSAAVVDPVGPAADNTRYLVTDPAAAPNVIAVTASGDSSEALYLQGALAVGEGAQGFRVRTLGGAAFSALTPEALAGVDVVVILGTRGLDRRGREQLARYARAGGALLLTAGPDVDPVILEGALAGVVRTTWRPRAERDLVFASDDSRHPVFRPFGGVATLGNVMFARSVAVSVGDAATVVARYSDGSPALVEETAGKGRVLVFASDLNGRWNDFPLQPVFVPFVHEVIRYLADIRANRLEYLVGDLPGPAGMTPGIESVAGRKAAINVDPLEFNLARITPDAFRAGIARQPAGSVRRVSADAREREDGQRLWQIGLLLMVVTLAAEGILGRRLG